jgi:signal peptidase II
VTVLLVAAAATLAVDVVTKALVTTTLAEGRLYGVAGGWGVRLVRNRRGGVLRLGPATATWLAVASGLALLVGLAQPGPAVAAGLGLVVGGAAGNVLDRLRRGAVVDFLAAGRWPVFNLADAAMTVGVTVVGFVVVATS